jgi:hypothetical protein
VKNIGKQWRQRRIKLNTMLLQQCTQNFCTLLRIGWRKLNDAVEKVSLPKQLVECLDTSAVLKMNPTDIKIFFTNRHTKHKLARQLRLHAGSTKPAQ